MHAILKRSSSTCLVAKNLPLTKGTVAGISPVRRSLERLELAVVRKSEGASRRSFVSLSELGMYPLVSMKSAAQAHDARSLSVGIFVPGRTFDSDAFRGPRGSVILIRRGMLLDSLYSFRALAIAWKACAGEKGLPS